jgi:exosome complex component MTR3
LDVFITVLESDGIDNCLAASSIAATTALANAGIEMLGLVVSCSAVGFAENIGISSLITCQATMQNGEIWMDPSSSEASIAKGTLNLAYIPALGAVTNVWQRGELAQEEVLKVSDMWSWPSYLSWLVKCIQKCQSCCSDLHAIVAQSLRDSIPEKIT